MFAKYGCSKYEKSIKNVKAIIVVRTLCTRHECAVNTMQQILARRRSVMDAIKTLWERRVDDVGRL